MEIVIADIRPEQGLGIHRPDEELAGRYYNDTGLCNRLLFWEIVQIVNKLHNDKFEVVVYDEQWPEKNIFDLPNTKFKPNKDINIENYLPITIDNLNDILSGKYKLSDTNYYTDFAYYQITDMSENVDRLLKTIKFKDNKINKLLKESVSNMIGIHVRRGRGVKFNKSVLDTLPESIRDDYYKKKLEDKGCWHLYIYDFIDDSTYFSYIDAILKQNPNQQFFISCDMEDKYFQHWYDRYPDNIVSKKDYYDIIDASSYLHEEIYSHDKPFLQKEGILHFYNFLDLYCLSNTKMLIKLFMSSWSDFASDYLGKDKVTVIAKQTSPRTILKLYKKNFQ
jgi:hypothetical protein